MAGAPRVTLITRGTAAHAHPLSVECMMKMRFANDGLAAYTKPRSASLGDVGALLSGPMGMVRAWARRRHDRRDLLRLDDHMLRDIGLDRSRMDEIVRA